METLLLVGIGVGLASVAGLRASVPLALAALLGALGLFELPSVGAGWFAAGVLAALAAVEIALDKVGGLDPAFGWVMAPLRAASGAVLFAAAVGWGAGMAPYLVAGAVVAGTVAVLKVVLRPSPRVSSAGVSTGFLSVVEDLLAVVGGAIAFFVPLVPLLLVAFLLFFFYRIRKRRGRKYGGLRILGD